MKKVWGLVAIATTAAACSSTENVGSSNEAITTIFTPEKNVTTSISPHCNGAAPGVETQETSAAWQAGSGDLRTSPSWLVGANDFCVGGLGLARAIDSGNTAPSWTSYCTMAVGSPTIPGCGPGGGDVPRASNVSGTVQQLAGPAGWQSDPYLATTRINFAPSGRDIVTYTALANSGVAQLQMIVTAISFDGGVTFPFNLYVNDSFGSGTGCDDGIQDQPAAAFDTTVFPPRLWVTWRHNGSGGTYGACTQFIDIDPNALTIKLGGTSSQPPQNVQNLDRTPFYGVGGLVVRAQNGRVTIVYSNSDHHYNCPSPPTNEMKWESVSSDTAGVTWTPSTLIRDSMTFAPCLMNNNYVNEIRSHGFINDATGDYYAALPVGKDTIEVWRSTDQGNTWGPAPVLTIPARSGNGSRAKPWLASDGAARLGLFWYESDTSTDMRVTPTFRAARNATTGLWDAQAAAGAVFLIDTASGPCNMNTEQCRTLGDYAGMAAKIHTTRAQKTYVPAWTAFPSGFPSVVGNERATAVSASVD